MSEQNFSDVINGEYEQDVLRIVSEYLEKNKAKQAKPTTIEQVDRISREFKVAWGSHRVGLAYSNIVKRFVAIDDPLIKGELLDRFGRRLNSSNISDIIDRMKNYAERSDLKIPMATRFYAPERDMHNIYQDLGDGRCIHLTPGRYKVIPHPDTFVFTPTCDVPLPDPCPEGTVNDLRDYLKPGLDDDQISLIIGWMLNVYNFHGSRTILYISGPDGSGKSTLAQKILHLLDPHGPFELLDQSLPNDMEDLGTHLKHMAILSYSNIDEVKSWLSTGISQIVTGTQIVNREKYSNFNMAVAQGKKNAILTGVDFHLDKQDARDRCLRILAEKLPYRVNEIDVADKFYDQQSKALGALCSIVCTIMKNYRVLKDTWKSNDRTDSLRYWVECGAKAMGWGDGYFSEIYLERRGKMRYTAIDENPIPDAVYEFLRRKHTNGVWIGRYKELMEYLHDNYWIDLTDRGMQAKLSQSISRLSDMGVLTEQIQARKNNGKGEIRLKFTPDEYNRVVNEVSNKLMEDIPLPPTTPRPRDFPKRG